LYINVKGGENLKTKADVEKFINGDHGDRFVVVYMDTDAENGRTTTTATEDFDLASVDDPDGQFHLPNTVFGAKVEAISGSTEKSNEELEKLVDVRTNLLP
jgi:hypothetical protein